MQNITFQALYVPQEFFLWVYERSSLKNIYFFWFLGPFMLIGDLLC